MKMLFTLTLICIAGIASSSDDLAFDKVNWSYEIFDDSGDPGEFNHSISKRSLSGKSPSNSENLDIPLKNVECLALPPLIHAKTMLISKGITCRDKGNPTFSYTSIAECGKSKKIEVSKSFIDGKFCETEKKCYRRSLKILFSCTHP